MNYIMSFVIVASMLTGSALAAESELKCYENKEFMKLIDDKNLVTLYNGVKGDKINEVMMSKSRYMYVVEYDKSPNGNALGASQYCIIGVLNDVTFNESAVEYLSKLLEKYKGQGI